MTIGVEPPAHLSLDRVPQNVIAQAVIDSLPDPLIVFDVAGQVRTMNRAAEILLHHSPSVPSNDPFASVDPHIRAVFRQLCAHVVDGQEPYVGQGPAAMVRLLSSNGEKCFLPRATPLYGPQGQFIGVTVIFQETIQIDAPDETHEDKLATLLHDFRSPLTSLQAAVQLCLEQVVGPLTEKQIHLLEIARDGCERLEAALEHLAQRPSSP